MAKIKLSSIGITNISGKAGGSVYSRNRGGSYVKNFVMPSNTITDTRQAVRAIFGVISGLWRNLTSGQRQSFTDQAPFYPVTDVFGDSKVLSGNALFQKLNTQLLNAGLPSISLALSPQGTNPITSSDTLSIAVGGASFDVEFGLSEDNTVPGSEYIIEVTPPHSASIKNVKNLFRQLRSTAQSGGSTPASLVVSASNWYVDDGAMYTAYTSRFGALAAGDVIDMRVKAINPNTGEESAYWYATAVVQA